MGLHTLDERTLTHGSSYSRRTYFDPWVFILSTNRFRKFLECQPYARFVEGRPSQNAYTSTVCTVPGRPAFPNCANFNRTYGPKKAGLRTLCEYQPYVRFQGGRPSQIVRISTVRAVPGRPAFANCANINRTYGSRKAGLRKLCEYQPYVRFQGGRPSQIVRISTVRTVPGRPAFANCANINRTYGSRKACLRKLCEYQPYANCANIK
jgi:hypothetical protein